MIDVALEAGELARAIGVVQGCVLGRTTMPVLQHLLIKAKAGSVSIFASSVDMEAEIEVPADVGKDGVVGVHAGVLEALTKRLPKAQTVALAPSAKNEHLMQLRCGKTIADLATMDVETMPVMAESKGQTFTLKSSDLKRILEIAGPVAKENLENRWQFAGVNLSVANGVLYGLGFSDKRGAVVEIPVDGVADDAFPEITVRNDSVSQLLTFCKSSETIELTVSPSLLVVKAGKAVLRARLLATEYDAKLRREFRAKSETPLFRAKASDLEEIVDRVSATFKVVPSGVMLVAAVGIKPLGASELRIVAGGVRGVNEAVDELAAEGVTSFPEVSLMTKDFSSVLDVFGDHMVEFRQDAPGAGVQITSPEVQGVRLMLSPLTKR